MLRMTALSGQIIAGAPALPLAVSTHYGDQGAGAEERSGSVAGGPPLEGVLCRRFDVIFPPGEDQHRGMTLERSRKNLRPLDPKADTIVLNRGKGSLSNARALGELVLAQALQLANDAHRFSH
jgi:hypothetical protein